MRDHTGKPRRFLMLLAAVVILAAGAVVFLNTRVVLGTEDDIVCVLTKDNNDIKSEEAEKIKALSPECAIVLGAGILDRETPTIMLKDRLDAGVLLYKKGLVPKLLLTGDNGTNHHNEIHVMLNYCIKAGVPKKDIFCDHAGFSTYDSMYREKNVFQVKKAVVVTQKYHLYRALYLADGMGMECLGAAADQQAPYAGQANRDFREVIARTKDVLKNKRAPAAKFSEGEIPISGDDGTITHAE